VAVLFLSGAASAVAFFPREAAFAFPPPSAATAAPQTPQAPPSQAPPQPADPTSEFERWAATQPRVNLPVSAEGAKVLIVRFSDYQCPACAQTYEWYKPILAKYQTNYPGQVRQIGLDFPLHPACNAAVTRPVHLSSCEAAVAVRLARERGRGDAMEQWAYTNQSATPEMVRAAAREVGGVPDFDARYAGAVQAIRTDAALGSLNNVRATPTFFINGLMITGGMPPAIFDAAIASELKRASK
jgi:protein-disulfide isomerase